MAESKGYTGRTVFTKGRAVLVLVIGATLLFAGVAYVSYVIDGWTWVSVSLAVIGVVFGVGGVIETLVERVELSRDALLVRRLWGTRRYPKHDIERVSQERGVPPAIQLRDGTWVVLPDVGSHFSNSARAWLRAERE